MIRSPPISALPLLACMCITANATTTTFFDASQTAVLVSSGTTSDTISSYGYLFTYTRDKLFTGGIGPDPIGRPVRVPWPQGVEAQAVTTPPPGITDHKARITIARVDGDVFDLRSFTVKLLANTAGAGASIEIMPLIDGEDAFDEPVFFNATGYYGSTFSYDESPNYLGSTATLKGFATYKIGLYVDFAFTALTLEGASVTGRPGDVNLDGAVNRLDVAVLSRSWGLSAGADWFSGDFDSDGAVTLIDLAMLQSNYDLPQAQAGTNPAAVVSEPSRLSMSVYGALTLWSVWALRRRRNAASC